MPVASREALNKVRSYADEVVCPRGCARLLAYGSLDVGHLRLCCRQALLQVATRCSIALACLPNRGAKLIFSVGHDGFEVGRELLAARILRLGDCVHLGSPLFDRGLRQSRRSAPRGDCGRKAIQYESQVNVIAAVRRDT